MIISAHWEEDKVSITSGSKTVINISIIMVFLKETYQIQYPAPGDPVLAG